MNLLPARLSTLSLFLSLSPLAAPASAREHLLSECREVKPKIQSAAPGDQIVLPNRECVLNTSIVVPTGVRITGRESTTLVGRAAVRFFLLDIQPGAEGVTIEGLRLRLSTSAVAIHATRPTNLRLSRLDIVGNLGSDPKDSAETSRSGLAVLVEGGIGIVAERLRVQETWGGLYFTMAPQDLQVADNEFSRVSLASVLVGGTESNDACAKAADGEGAPPPKGVCAERIWITGNRIDHPGFQSRFEAIPPGGDGITIDAARSVVVQNNLITDSNCYGMWIQRVNKLTLSGNTVERGITAGIYVQVAAEAVVQHNAFNDQAGTGLLMQDADDVLVVNNTFREGRLLVYTGSERGLYAGNAFLKPRWGTTHDASEATGVNANVVVQNK